MSKPLLAASLALAAAATGCSLFHKDPFVPADMRGDVPIIIANNTNEDVCEFAANARHEGAGNNWLGTEKLKPHQAMTFHVRADWYAAGFMTCGGAEGSIRERFTIKGPTYLSYTQLPSHAPPGYTLLEFETHATTYEGEPPPIEEAPAAAEPGAAQSGPANGTECTKSGQRTAYTDECCSKSVHKDPMGRSMICD